MAQTDKQVIGQIGENCATTYLERHGYTVIERNYRKKYGEIDIIALKDGNLHFVEVKSVTADKIRGESSGKGGGLSSDPDDEDYEAEENVHPWKLKRLRRTIEVYLLSKYPDDEDEEPDWQLDVVTVEVDREAHVGRVRILEDIDIC
ncbi:MAG: YraN family protein [Candidatus Paceibacterota bacterium]|jgi:putative endonuclease